MELPAEAREDIIRTEGARPLMETSPDWYRWLEQMGRVSYLGIPVMLTDDMQICQFPMDSGRRPKAVDKFMVRRADSDEVIFIAHTPSK